MKDRITIGTKLMISAGGLLALLVILSYASLQAIATLDSHLDVVANKTAKKVSLAGRMQTATAEMRAAVRSEILSAALNTGELESAHEAFVRAAGTVEESIRQIRPLLTTARGRAAVDRLAQNLTAWMPLEEEMARLCAKGLLKEANQLRRTAQMEAANAMNESAGEVLTILEEQLAEAAGAGAQAVVRSRWTALLLLGLGLAAGAAVLFVVRQINRRLRQFAAELREGAEQTAGAASQVSLSSQAVAQGANEQASSLEETSASSEQVKAAARQNSENSRVAAELVQRTQDGYSAANVSLEQAVAAMAEINDQSGKIAKIIKVIDEIAFQTNILALNAAVEAARAGEAGMGFAVVADEVRSLAQRSAQAARDTAALIEESISKSAAGKAKVDQVAVAIRAITEEELRVKALVDEVNLGSQEQARGIEQIGQALSQIEEVTQRAAANAEESASAAEQLHAQSEALMGLVERLTAMVDGQASGSSRPQPPLGRRGRAQQPPALSDGAARPRGDAGTSASMGLTATAQPRTAGSQAGGSLQGS